MQKTSFSELSKTQLLETIACGVFFLWFLLESERLTNSVLNQTILYVSDFLYPANMMIGSLAGLGVVLALLVYFIKDFKKNIASEGYFKQKVKFFIGLIVLLKIASEFVFPFVFEVINEIFTPIRSYDALFNFQYVLFFDLLLWVVKITVLANVLLKED